MTDRGAQAQRTSLAWQRTALAAGACTLLLLHSASLRHWGATTIPAIMAGCTALALAIVGGYRERRLRVPGRPPAAGHRILGGISLMVTATAVTTLLLG
jgi:uncharacterized membrane protein YidH (DUF202 family)